MGSSKPLWSAMAAVSSVLCLVGSAAASDVTGKLVLGAYKPPVVESDRPTSYWEAENGFKEVQKDRVDAPRELSVVLVGKGEVKLPDRLEVAFDGGSLLPSTLVVRVGTTVLFKNDDEVAHELFAPGFAPLAAEATSPRGRRSVQLNETGSWPLRDKLIPHLAGHLHVLSDLLAVAQVDASGGFSFGEIAPGTYTLKVFHGPKELVSQSVEVTGKGLTVPPIALGAGADN